MCIKRSIRLIMRKFKDYREHTLFCKRGAMPHPAYSISSTQVILPSASFAEKQYNLRYAAELIKEYIIRPRETLSFWDIVGNPHRLKSSRCIRNNKVTMERGGGLCQVASIIYHLALLGGLKIAERHHHSIDLYGDGPRACPMGLDATVSYGYKDLRIYNPTNAVLRFKLSVINNKLHAELQSDSPLPQHEIEIEKTELARFIRVNTRYAATGEMIAENIYKRLCTGAR